MPYRITSTVMAGLSKTPQDLARANYKYVYPFGRSLKPGTELHNKIRDRILERARASRTVMQERYPSWREIDQMCTVYVAADDAEVKVQDDDARKPVSLVIPVLYSARETLLTYMVSAFLNDPIFRYQGTGPEDVIGAQLLQASIRTQCYRAKIGLYLYLMWQDAFQYGTGYCTVRWDTKWGKRNRTVERYMPDPFGGNIPYQDTTRVYEPVYEGNYVDVIDPYLAFPDPNVKSFEVQKGEYFGWLDYSNRLQMLSDEEDNGAYFNAKYLKHIGGRSVFRDSTLSDRDRFNLPEVRDDTTNPVDNIIMYIRIIPKEWGLGSKPYPELWLFTLSGDQVLTRAEPLDLDHGMIPVAATSPDTDGHSTSPMSRLEVVYPSQHAINWLWSAHVANVRKALNDVMVVDPSRINMADFLKPGPGKVIRLRKSAWGRGRVEDAITQMPVVDVTKSHVADASTLMQLLNRAAGTVDQTQGIFRGTSERVSAEEASNVHFGAMSKMQKIAYMISTMAHWDVAHMMASHTQQFSELDTYLRLTAGSLDQSLFELYGGRMRQGADGALYAFTAPSDLQINYDVIGHDGTIPTVGNLKDMIPLYQAALQSPELMQKIDIVRLFMNMGQMAGFKNMQDFARFGPPPNMQVQQPEAIQQGLERGNIVPFGG